jgi:hypothetical protein
MSLVRNPAVVQPASQANLPRTRLPCLLEPLAADDRSCLAFGLGALKRCVNAAGLGAALSHRQPSIRNPNQEGTENDQLAGSDIRYANASALLKQTLKFSDLFLQVVDDENLRAVSGLNSQALAHASLDHGEISGDRLNALQGSERTFPRLFPGHRIKTIWMKENTPIGYYQLAT